MKRRKRRARRNPPAAANTVLTLGGVAGVFAAVFGAPQLGGILMLGSGTYALMEGNPDQKLYGGFYDAVGVGMLLVGRR